MLISSFDQNKAGDALKIYDNLLKSHPRSPRAVFGKAQALNVKAEIERRYVFNSVLLILAIIKIC